MSKRFFIVAIVVIALGIVGFANRMDHNAEDQSTVMSTENKYHPIVVLELFTSQGCSSCPSADRLLEEVKKLHPNHVFTLSYHVDYWNYIGWEDPFSSSEYAEKQSVYNQKLKYRGNYTPEVVVNGKSHFTGSNRVKMNAAILAYGKEMASNKVTISKTDLKNGLVSFDCTVKGNLTDKNLRAILVLDERTTEVKSGENRNRTIKNSNIVIAEKVTRLSDTSMAGEIMVPEAVKPYDTLRLVLLVENRDNDITAAAKKTL